MSEIDKYCFEILNCTSPFTVREDEGEHITEPCNVLEYNGKIYFSVVSDIAGKVKDVISDTLSDDMLSKLRAICDNYIKDRGMTIDKKISVIRRYLIESVPKSSPVIAERLNGGEKNILLSDISELCTFGPCYGVFEKDTVVSLCGAVLRGNIAEIHIETEPKSRKKGYAASCLTAISTELLARKYEIMYECRSENAASRHTIERVGGTLHSRYVRFIGRK